MPIADSAFGALTPGFLSTAGVLLITLCVVSMLRRRLKARHAHHADPSRTRPTAAADARARLEARRSIDASLADAEDLVRRFAAHLDTKAARLEKLIRDADDRIARLSASARAQPHPPAEPERPADPISRDVYDLADQGLPPIEIAQRLSEGVGKVELILALRDP